MLFQVIIMQLFKKYTYLHNVEILILTFRHFDPLSFYIQVTTNKLHCLSSDRHLEGFLKDFEIFILHT